MSEKEKIHHHFDTHMHTPLCGHSLGEPSEYVDQAAHRGISLIAFTCHIPLSRDDFGTEGIRMEPSQIADYRELIRRTQDYGAQKNVTVLYGIEAEIFPDKDLQREMEDLIAHENFDFVLGSLHHMLPAWRQWMEAQGCNSDADKIRAYFENLALGAATGLYHSIAHPDVIRVYKTLEGPFVPADSEAPIKAALSSIAESGTCLEINTSGLIKGDFIVHPDPLIMKWALERKVPFTIGSDAHVPERVGDQFEEIIRQYRKLGLQELNYFRKGQRVRVPL